MMRATLLFLLAVAMALPVAAEGQDAAITPRPRIRMTQYYLVLLRPGPAPAFAEAAANTALWESHMDNIRRLGDAGQMIVAGPIADADNLQGIFVLKADSMAHARAIVDSDPAIRARRLVAEIFTWYAPAGLLVRPETLSVKRPT